MQRVTDVIEIAFWTSVPAFAGYLAVTPRDGRLGWPGEVLWRVVAVSYMFLTEQLALPTPSREEGGELAEPGGAGSPKRASEWLVYTIVLCLAVYLFSSQGSYY